MSNPFCAAGDGRCCEFAREAEGVVSGEIGEAMASSSGLAMRKPPREPERFRSPFMLRRGAS